MPAKKKFSKTSMRTKSALVVIVIMISVSAVNFATSMFFTRQGVIETMQQNMSLARDIADRLVTTKVDLLKSDARTVAERLMNVEEDEDLDDVMLSQLDLYEDFMAFTVFDQKGIVEECGYAPTDLKRLRESKYLSTAFNGASVISTTRIDEGTGELVMHVCVPMNKGRILSVTIPGLLLTDLLSSFKAYKTGNIFILDEEGTVIANVREDIVLNRVNYLDVPASDKQWENISTFTKRMIKETNGFGEYTFDGVQRICAFKRVTSYTLGWSLGVAAPLQESPVAGVQKGLLSSNLILIGAGLVLAFFLAKPLSRPYEKIHEQKQRLESLREVAVSASEAKSNFLANMSHEMRTPLNAIIGLSQLALGAERMDSESEQNIQKVHSAGMSLLGIVNDILDLSKIEAGKFEIVNDAYDIASLINDTITVNMVRIGSKPIKFELDISSEIPEKLRGDELRIKQLLNNLLSNAFKYTKEGSVTWKIYTEKDEGGLWLVSEIKDTGIGIKPEDIAKLFSNYNQVDPRSNRKIEGTGLGLSITKNLAEMMGGDVLVESEYGKGSVFTLRIRQGETESPVIGADIAQNLQNFNFNDSKRIRNEKLVRIRLPYARVLVVDDVATNLDVARGILKPYGIQVECAFSGQEAIDLIKGSPGRYDAIFMDHMMPGMDGIEATKIIRNEIGTEYAKTVPILALTANAIVGNETIFLENGFQAFLSKPIDIMAMDAAVRKWIRNKEKEEAYEQETGKDILDRRAHSDRRTQSDRRSGMDRRKLSELAMESETMESLAVSAENLLKFSAPGFDVERGIARFGGDAEIYLDVLRSYLKNTPPLFEKLSEPIKDNLADYAIVVHGIKASSRSIGAEPVGAKAEALEKAAKEGDIAFVNAENQRFIESVGALLGHIKVILDALSGNDERPMAQSPDMAVLEKLKEACAAFDIDGVDHAMDALRAFRYESGAELVEWLEGRVEKMGFKEVAERLSKEVG
jgi:signal transduction histidine kinase/CheY-like chemotaxis protein/HPt (histidine-containing phosphotransfer) domain-containing protein